jgi:hypothetical protein
LTLLRMKGSDTIAALNGDNRTTPIGWCKTNLDYNGNTINLGCISLGIPDSCSTFVLENTITGQKNPVSRQCSANYTPYTAYELYPVMPPTVYRQRVRDPQGLAKYSVDASQLANARIFMETYKPVAHFTRQLIIPEMRLGDWEEETGNAGPGKIPAP